MKRITRVGKQEKEDRKKERKKERKRLLSLKTIPKHCA